MAIRRVRATPTRIASPWSSTSTTTVTVSAYGAIVLSLPIVIYQLYAFARAFGGQRMGATPPVGDSA